jgi:TonB-dependent starch-binding outer membrane protein SusC
MKKTKLFGELFCRSLKKTLLIMRIAVILMILGILQARASDAYSQKTRLSINFSETELVKVLDKIEDESEFFFLYNEKLLDTERKVNITENDQLINVILDNLFAGTDVKYTIIDRKIILAPEYLKETPQAQQKQVTGKVTDKNGNILSGVTITVKGTTIGTLSDVNGNFSLALPPDAKTLLFSFVGMQAQEVEIGSGNVYNITLSDSFVGLEEVVVVGYSTQQKKSLTSSVSTVKSSQLSVEIAANPISRLQGKAAGVTVVNSHTPGGEADVLIRGLSTINNSNPLYIIDGVQAGGISMVNTEEIESITVLKDATSAAIYGARGANGVILITTKRGSAGRQKVSFSTRYGISNFKNPFTMLNSEQMGEMLWLQAKNLGVPANSPIYGSGTSPVVPDYIVPAGAMEGDPRTDPSLYSYDPDNFYNITKANKKGTDWYDEIIAHNAMLSESNLEISGGGEKGVYSVNFGYLTQEGTVKYTDYNRFTVRANSDMKVNKWLKIGESLGAYISKNSGDFGDANEWTAIGYANTMWAIIPLKDIKGNWAGSKGTGATGQNPLGMLYRSKDNTAKNTNVVGNLFAEVRIIDGLKLKTLFGYNLGSSNSRSLYLQSPEAQEPNYTDQLDQGNNESSQWNWTNTLDYTKAFGKHNVNILLGTEAISNTYRYFGASRSTFYTNTNTYMELSSGQADVNNYGGSGAVTTASYFGRLNYNYSGRYLLEFTLRRDGSSRFGQNNRWGNFPAASVGWLISDESFMSGTKNIISSLKLRGGYGLSGNDQIGDYNGFSLYANNIYASYYAIDGSYNSTVPGFYKSTVGNPDAKWESTATTDVGLDVAILDNTLTATLDVWSRNTSDMLFAKQIPYVAGGAAAPAVNIGKLNNKGFDLTLNYGNDALNGDLKYNVGLTFSKYTNEIESISDSKDEFISGTAFRYQVYTRAQAGTAYPEFYGLIVDGIFQTQDEANDHPAEFGGAYNSPGHFKFRDISGPDGVPDNIIDAYDNTYIGSPHPKYTAGFNFDVTYKAFNLSGFLYTSQGNMIADYTGRWRNYGIFSSNLSTDALYKSWGSPYLSDNKNATLPIMDNNDISVYPSTAHLQDGSYIRLKTLQLTYTLPRTISNKLTLENLQLYVQATNLFTITKFDGWDPEIVTRGIDKGVQTGQWPTPKMILFGIKLDL